jgi:RND superfamily putative drug exporter
VHRRIAGRLTGRRTKWLVLAGWIVVLVVAAPFAGKLTDVQNNETSSWLPGDAESTRALAELAPFQDSDDIPTALVYESDSGEPLTAAQLGEITAQLSELSALDGVVGEARGPLVSSDGAVAQSVVTFNFGADGWNEMPSTADELREVAEVDGVSTYVAGAGGQAADAAEAFAGIDGTLLFATLGVVVLILLFTYRSPVLWLLPIVSSLVALTTTQAIVYFLAKYADLTVNGQSQGILTVLVIGAGTDYALLLVARYREELRRHDDRHEAMAFALHRAAPAILASAATVALGMLCLLFAEMNSTAGLGPVLAIGVVVTFVVMVTLLPALLVLVGRWVFWPRRPTFGSDEPTTHGLWARVGSAIAPRPRRVWVVTSLLLAAACLGTLQLDTGGLSTEQQYTREFESVTGQRVLEDHGLADTSNQLLIVANADRVDAVVASLDGVEGIGTPSADVPPVDGTALVQAPVDGDPAGKAAMTTVERVRAAAHTVDGADALVGGGSAIFYDVQEASARDNLVIIPVILLVVMLILMALLRAVVAPLLLMGTVVLSFGAALGISTLLFHGVFTHLFSSGEGFRHADASFPLFVFVFLVALGIDYNIFLMTRVREETETRGTRQGSLVALRATGGVITSAGLVLAATFAVLGSLPLVFLAELGTAVALGVVLDTMIVRSVLVTALNLDLGGRIWWPSRLDRGEHRVDPLADAGGSDGDLSVRETVTG